MTLQNSFNEFTKQFKIGWSVFLSLPLSANPSSFYLFSRTKAHTHSHTRTGGSGTRIPTISHFYKTMHDPEWLQPSRFFTSSSRHFHKKLTRFSTGESFHSKLRNETSHPLSTFHRASFLENGSVWIFFFFLFQRKSDQQVGLGLIFSHDRKSWILIFFRYYFRQHVGNNTDWVVC